MSTITGTPLGTPAGTPTVTPPATPADQLGSVIDAIDRAIDAGEAAEVHIYRVSAEGRQPVAKVPADKFDVFGLAAQYGPGRYMVRLRVAGKWTAGATIPAGVGASPSPTLAAAPAPATASPLDLSSMVGIMLQQSQQTQQALAQQSMAQQASMTQLLTALLTRDDSAKTLKLIEATRTNTPVSELLASIEAAQKMMRGQPVQAAAAAPSPDAWAPVVQEVLGALKQAPSPQPQTIPPDCVVVQRAALERIVGEARRASPGPAASAVYTPHHATAVTPAETPSHPAAVRTGPAAPTAPTGADAIDALLAQIDALCRAGASPLTVACHLIECASAAPALAAYLRSEKPDDLAAFAVGRRPTLPHGLVLEAIRQAAAELAQRDAQPQPEAPAPEDEDQAHQDRPLAVLGPGPGYTTEIRP